MFNNNERDNMNNPEQVIKVFLIIKKNLLGK